MGVRGAPPDGENAVAGGSNGRTGQALPILESWRERPKTNLVVAAKRS